MTRTPGRAYPQTGVGAFTVRQRAAVDAADAAQGTPDLTSKQQSAKLGDPIPIVFCARSGGIGGCWISPPATFARFENDANDTLTVWYHLVVSDGEILGISTVWQGDQLRAGPGAVSTPERPVATVSREYDRRAGSWRPGKEVAQNWIYYTTVTTTEVKGAAIAHEDDIEKARARIQLTSKSNYVTRYDCTVEMIDWDGRIPVQVLNGIVDKWTTTTYAAGQPYRNLGDWSYSRERSIEEKRIELEHVEDVYWKGFYIGGCTYRCTITEEGTDPARIYRLPEYTGDGRGDYSGLSTVSFSDIYPIGNDTWDQQIHIFVENGLEVPYLLQPGEGPSNMMPELALYLLRRRMTDDQLDVASFTDAVRFNSQNGLLFNGVLAVPANVRDWLHRIAPFYLLRVINRGGQIGLRPALPTDGDGNIDQGAVSPVMTFTEDDILPGSFRLEMIGAGDRKPFIAQMIWRDQPLDQIGMPRMVEVRRDDTPDDAPVEQFDLVEFCCTEDHAVKAAIYQHARRHHINHRLSIDVLPSADVAALVTGDVVRVTLQRMVTGITVGVTVHDFFYELDSVSASDDGITTLQLTHYPVTGEQQSVYALEVARGASVREGFDWAESPAEFGQTLDEGAVSAVENLDDVKGPPNPYQGTASMSYTFDAVGDQMIVRVCMDKPVQSMDMGIRLSSQLIAFNNQRINIPIGQTCGEITIDNPGLTSEPAVIGMDGVNGGGFVNPDISDTIEVSAPDTVNAGMVWLKLNRAGGDVFPDVNTTAYPLAQYGYMPSPDAAIGSDDKLRFTVFSGDGKQSVDSFLSFPGYKAFENIAIPTPPPLFINTDTAGSQGWCRALVLPVGNGTAIVVVVGTCSSMKAWQWEDVPDPEVAEEHTFGPVQDAKAFLVTHTTCAEVDVPDDFLSHINNVIPIGDWAGRQPWKTGVDVPGPSDTSGPYWYTRGSGARSRITLDILKAAGTAYGMMRSTMEASDESYWMDMDTHCVASPAIYDYLLRPLDVADAFTPAVPIENIEFQTPSTVKAALESIASPAPIPDAFVTPDVRPGAGGFQVLTDKIIDGTDADYPYDVTGLYNDVDGLITDVKFARLPVDPPNAWLGTTVAQDAAWEDAGTLAFADESTRIGTPVTFDNSMILITHWDWGQPTYCRNQLLALGFTEEDLTP